MECECNECDWVGYVDELDIDEDDIGCCPECGSEDIYYFE